MQVQVRAWDEAAKLAYRFIDDLKTTDKESHQYITYHNSYTEDSFYRIGVTRLQDGLTKKGKIYEKTHL